MQNEDCKIVITLRSEREYEGPKLLVIEESDVRDEPTLKENVSEQEFKKSEEIIMNKEKKSLLTICLFLQLFKCKG